MSQTKKAPPKPRVIDLDKVRAERVASAEVKKQPLVVKLGGKQFELPPEMPASFAVYANDGQLLPAFRALLGEEQVREFLDDTEMSLADMGEFARAIAEAYGLSPEGLPALPGS